MNEIPYLSPKKDLDNNNLYLSPSPKKSRNPEEVYLSSSNRKLLSYSAKRSPNGNLLPSPFNRIDRWLDKKNIKWFEEGYHPNHQFQENSAKKSVIRSILSLHSLKIKNSIQQYKNNNNIDVSGNENTPMTQASQGMSLLERRLSKMKQKNISNFESGLSHNNQNTNGMSTQKTFKSSLFSKFNNSNNNMNSGYGDKNSDFSDENSSISSFHLKHSPTKSLNLSLKPKPLTSFKVESISCGGNGNDYEECQSPGLKLKKVKKNARDRLVRTLNADNCSIEDEVQSPKQPRKSLFSIKNM